jgi:CheY-like chemotaxis protein
MYHDGESTAAYEVALVQDQAGGDLNQAEAALENIARDFNSHITRLDILFLEPSLLVCLLRLAADSFTDELTRELALEARRGHMRVLKPTLLSAEEREHFVRERLARFSFRERGVQDVGSVFAALRAHVEDRSRRRRSQEGRLAIWYSNEFEFLQSLKEDELFVPSRAFPPLGSRLRMAVELGTGQGPLTLSGQVVDVERGADVVGTTGFTVRLDVSPARRKVVDGFVRAVRNRAPWSRESGRRVRRFSVRLPVEYIYEDRVRSERIGNLSEGGLFIESTNPPPPGTRLAMRVHAVGRTHAVQLLGCVAHTMTRAKAAATGATSGMGVEFSEPNDAVRAKLERLVGSVEQPRRVRALVVDDDRLFRVMIGSVLEDVGFTVLEAADGKEALAKLMDSLLDLQVLIVDLNLPGMMGDELVEMVRSVGGQEDLSVIVVTGVDLDSADTERLAALGADAVVPKSDAPEAVLEHACALLKRTMG